MTSRPSDPTTSRSEESPGVPGFRRWRAVYVFVLGAFVVLVALLAWFSRTYR